MPRLFAASAHAIAAMAAAQHSLLPPFPHARGSDPQAAGRKSSTREDAEEEDDFLLEDELGSVDAETNTQRSADLGSGSSSSRKSPSSLELLSASLSTLHAVLQSAGGLLSPFLSPLIALSCLQPAVLSCSHAPVVTASADIRQLLVKQFHVRDWNEMT